MAARQSWDEYCDRLGLLAQHLIDQLPAIKDDDLTNGVVLEIFTHYKIMNDAVDRCGLRSESMPQTQLRTLFNPRPNLALGQAK